MLAKISRELVQLHREFYGKGPNKAKTHAVNDTILTILKDGFTTAERTLIEAGKSDDVELIRRSFQHAMHVRFTEVVERATGRAVLAHLSQVHTEPDITVELFVLEPEEETQAPEAQATETP